MLKLKNSSYEELVDNIKEKQKQIIVYGTGAIGQTIIPEVVKDYNLQEYLQFFVDANPSKQKETIGIGGINFPIRSLKDLQSYCDKNKNTVILITNSRFYSILEELDGIPELDGIESYIVPVMQLTYFSYSKNSSIRKVSNEPLIPKVINYCWFSGNEMPGSLKRCIDSWKKYCPDYEIKRWDESNYDISKSSYMKGAYESKKWGFIPDYARLDILYNYGGFYLDTDVELVRSLDELRYQPAFSGVEKWSVVNIGGCSGAVAHHPMIKELFDERKNVSFVKKDGSLNMEASGTYEMRPLLKAGMKMDNTMQTINDLTIYPSDFFHPYDYMSGQTKMTKNTFSIHHFSGGWLDKKEREQKRKTQMQYTAVLERMKHE